MNNSEVPSKHGKNISSKAESVIFASIFIFIILFFLLTLWINKGPIDQPEQTQVASFTEEERLQRNQQWQTSSPLAIKEGQKLFEVLVFGQLQPIFDLILQGEYGSTEVELYKILTYGLPGTIFKSWDYLPQFARWQIVHYIRSTMSEPPSATKDEWDTFNKERI